VLLWDHQRRGLVDFRTTEYHELSKLPSLLDGSGTVGRLCHLGDEIGILRIEGVEIDSADLDVLAAAMATALRASEPAIDTLNRRRRRRDMALPAELQWSLLPPTSLQIGAVDLTAAIEPAYDTGGDVFDYALDGDRLFLGVLDARGHGLRAAATSAVATSAMRRARRQELDIEEIAAEIGRSIAALGEDEFVSAVLVDIDLVSWSGRWLSAGHLPPLMVDIESGDICELPLRPALPLGMVINGQTSDPLSRSFEIDPGASLVLYSDGIVENVSVETGLMVGDDVFRAALLQELLSPRRDETLLVHRARRVIEVLLGLGGDELRDDATIMILRRRSD
jgi:serine phosphatase RsbU (regulator of sigma subunit)